MIELDDNIKTISQEQMISASVLDVAITTFDDILKFFVISNDSQYRLNCYTFNADMNTLTSVSCWLDQENFSDSPMTERNKFLETLPKFQVDKTGLQVYFEQKRKRMKTNDNVKFIDSEDDDE